MKDVFHSKHVLHGLGFEGNGKLSSSHAYTWFLEYTGSKIFSRYHYLKFLDFKYLQRYSFAGNLFGGSSLILLESRSITKNKQHANEDIFEMVLSEFCDFYDINPSDFRILDQRKYNTSSLLGFRDRSSISCEIMNTKAITYRHLSKILDS